MTRHPTRARSTRPQRILLVATAVLAVLSTQAGAQLATWVPPIPPESTMTLEREGAFEVWREDTYLGLEEYRIWRSPTGDSLFAFSLCEFDLDGDPDSTDYQKQTIQLTRAIDQMPLYFQVVENAGGAVFTGSVSFRDTVAQIYHEGETGGKAWTQVVPEGKLFLLDPGTYQLVEFLLGDFARRGLAGRSHTVFVLRNRQTLEVELQNFGEQEVEWPAGRKTAGVVAEMTDGVTAFKGWFDKEGRLLILEAPSYRTRVIRRAE